MLTNSQIKRIPGLRKAAAFMRLVLHPNGYKFWDRVIVDQEAERLIGAMDLKQLSALEISGQKWKDRGFGRYASVEYPTYDVCSDVLADQFDVIIAEHVFEHVLWPYRAVHNVFKMLSPNGAFFIITPFLIRVHNYPVDCSRWTERGIRHLLAEGGFDISKITTGSWGNRACVRADFLRWTPYNRWLNSLKNEPDYPVVVWALARK